MNAVDVHGFAGAYALHALDNVEREAFARHLAECETCAIEVAEFELTAARLADDTFVTPPPRLKDAVMARVRQTRQTAAPEKRSRAPKRRAQSWRHRTLATLVAASFVALAGLSGVFVVQAQQATNERDRIESVLAASDANLRTSPLQGGGRVNVVTSASRDSAVVVLTEGQPGASKALQLWFVRGTDATSLGVLPEGEGDVTKYVTGLSGVDAVGVSVEPPGGSSKPTTIVGLVPLRG